MQEEKKMFKYQDEFNLCINRIREVLPKVSLSNLDDINILIDDDASCSIKYDNSSRIITINSEMLDEEIDVSRLVMDSILEVISTNNSIYGISGVESLSKVNQGVSRIINNLLISNEEDYSDFSLINIVNILIGIVGTDFTMDSFFNQKGDKFYQKLVDKLGRDNTDKMLSLINDKCDCSEIQDLISSSYLQDETLQMSEAERFKASLFTEVSLLPDRVRSDYEDCVYAHRIVDDYINKRASADDLEIMLEDEEIEKEEELVEGTVLL